MTETREQEIARLRAEAAALFQHADALDAETTELFGANVVDLGAHRAAQELDIPVRIDGNNACIRETCPLCGRGHNDADSPLWFMVERRGICQGCADAYYPAERRLVEGLNGFMRGESPETWAALKGFLSVVNAALPTPGDVLRERAELERELGPEFDLSGPCPF